MPINLEALADPARAYVAGARKAGLTGHSITDLLLDNMPRLSIAEVCELIRYAEIDCAFCEDPKCDHPLL